MRDSSTPAAMPIPSDTFWSRLKTTPLSDILRGRLTARLDFRRAIASANLPEPLAILIYHKVRRARLWSAGRFNLAQALANRVRADLDAGRVPEELALSFGNSKQFAKWFRQEARRDLFWARLVHIPFRDVLRGRLTARLDLRRAIAAAALPEPLANLIYSVARRTRLWRTERVDVARELADYFRDGIDVGGTPEQLIASFGDLRQTARLIRRAKLRSRPWAWKVWRRTWQAVGIFVVLVVASYLFLLVRFILARPTIGRNYALEITAPAHQIAQAERAWPLYREALLRVTPRPKMNESEIDISAERVGGEHWELVLNWVRENQTALEITRQGGARPHLGFVYGDAADGAWYKHDHVGAANMDLRSNRELMGLLLPQMQAVQQLAALLGADALRATAEGDRTSLMSDLQAMIGIAQQLHDDLPFLVVDLVSFSVLNNALAIVDGTLAQQPQLFTEGDLQQLAHSIAAYGGGGALHCRLEGERLMFRDLYQRIYTDDGHGDGHLTHEGLTLLRDLQDALLWGKKSTELPSFVTGPSISAVILSRRPMTELTEQMYDRLESEFHRPLWDWQYSTVLDDLRRWKDSPLETMRHLPLVTIMTSAASVAIAGERTTQKRDATLAALALELYRRQQGSWPKQLVDLTPHLLPTVPPDRFTGKPLAYRLVDGRPMLYSAGPDRDDDAGRSIQEDPDNSIRYYASDRPPDGDWILWPPQPKVDQPSLSTETN